VAGHRAESKVRAAGKALSLAADICELIFAKSNDMKIPFFCAVLFALEFGRGANGGAPAGSGNPASYYSAWISGSGGLE
jgi:hypothetical protein